MRTRPVSLYAVTRVQEQRIAIYSPELIYPTPEQEVIRLTLEVGQEAPIEVREYVRDGEVQIGPDALSYTDAGQALFEACEAAGVSFYRVIAIISRHVERYARAERIREGWLNQRLQSVGLACLGDRDADGAWEVQTRHDGRVYCLIYPSLRHVAAAFGIRAEQPR